MTTTEERPATGQQFRVVGTRPIRHDGVDKVTGRAKYGADIILPGMLYGKVLRSPHPHARIKAIDASAALAMPGVKAVVTAADMPIIKNNVPVDLGETLANSRLLCEISLAPKKALFVGHAVAAVAAVSPHIAEEALEKIKVDYEVLPFVQDVLEAMKPTAPLLHENMTMLLQQRRFTRGEDSGQRGNIASRLLMQQGDLEAGFEEAEVILEREYRTTAVHQGYIEPHNGTAYWGPDGRVTVWTSTQGHFGVRGQLAAMLGLPDAMIKVIAMEIGGGFGGKISLHLDAVAALLSRKSGHPVKMTMSRSEVFQASGPTAGTVIRLKLGAKRDGRITAADAWLAYEAGAYPGSPMGAGVSCIFSAYRIPNMRAEGYDVVVNKPKVAAYRAPGAPQAAFALESALDELAEQLHIDPLDLRLKNAIRTGDRLVSGVAVPKIGCVEVIEAMKRHPQYTAPLPPNTGRGVAIGYWSNTGGASSATIAVNPSGKLALITGSPDIGGTRAATAQQVAEVLGIAAEDITPNVGDTDTIGFTGPTGGSRVAFATGIAAINAAEEIKRQVKARAATLWQTTPDEIIYEQGVISSKSNPANKATFKELIPKIHPFGGPIVASASASPTGVGPSYAGTIADVRVDPETGKTDVVRCTIVQDVGKAVHPGYVEGQMQGGTVQGIGWALNEEYVYNANGAMANPTYLDYRIPTTLDLPMIETVMVEVPNPGHPFGVRGVGEISIVTPMAAIANAVRRATGVRIRQLPLSPATILKERRAAKANGAK
ncbi:MAG: xanthine dehydrogenase family protein molybdopterin-binding subunit [Chloroflexi bacterium]|nr:xanthine dehydrogenase family protein molybdopterin-binding subunit [Chloroflexota bacterium]